MIYRRRSFVAAAPSKKHNAEVAVRRIKGLVDNPGDGNLRILAPGLEMAEGTQTVTTLLVKSDRRCEGLWTKAAYVGHIVKGLPQHEVPEEYVQHVIDAAVATNRHMDGGADEESIQMLEELRKRGA